MIKNLKFQIKNLLLLFIFFTFAERAQAVSLIYSNIPSTISSDSFSVTVTVDGASPGTNYLRVDLFKEGTSNYFGETQTGSGWYQGSEGKRYYPITIGSDKIATASVTARVGQPSLSDYPNPGEYYLRIRRYTESGNPAGSDNQTPTKINITAPAASPSPSPEPTSKPTPSSTPIATIMTKPSVIPSLRPRPRLSSPRLIATPSNILSPQVLGVTESAKSSMFPSLAPKEGTASASIAFPAGIILVLGGILLSGGAGFLAFKKTQVKD